MRIVAALALVLGSCLIAAEATAPESTLLEPGLFHGDEVRVSSTTGWLGLVPEGTGFALTNLTLRVARAHDAVIDAPNEKTGIQVTVDNPTPVFLARDIAGLTPGAVTSYSFRQAESSPAPRQFSIPINGGGREYRLELVRRPGGQTGDPRSDALILSTRDAVQVLFEWPHGLREAHLSLIWAGDLDGDAKPDLYMDLSDHYNVTDRRLYLSSAAAEGELVKEVATFRTVGC